MPPVELSSALIAVGFTAAPWAQARHLARGATRRGRHTRRAVDTRRSIRLRPTT